VSPKINLIFIGESYLGGMAGSKRIQNIINPLMQMGNISISNFIAINANETSVMNGVNNGVVYKKARYSANPITLFIFFLKGCRFMLRSKKKVSKNILYCYDTPNFLTFPFLCFAKLINIKTVVDLVEDYTLVDTSTMSFTKKMKLGMQDLLLKKIYVYSDAVLVLSNYLKKLMEAKVKNRIPVYFMPITVDMHQFQKIKERNAKVIKLFYGGSFGDKDGILYLLQAFEVVCKEFPDIEFVLTGKPPKAGMQVVLDHINRSEVKNKIKYLGYLSDDEYYKTMNSCDIFCATRINSKYANAGFPFKLGEMLATGKPVLTSDVGDVGTYLKNKVNAIIVTPESVTEIVEGLAFLLKHPDEAGAIGSKGWAVADKYFNAEKRVVELKEFMLSI